MSNEKNLDRIYDSPPQNASPDDIRRFFVHKAAMAACNEIDRVEAELINKEAIQKIEEETE